MPLQPTDWKLIGEQLVLVYAVIIMSMSLIGFTINKLINWVVKQRF